MPTQDYLTTEEAANFLRLKRNTLEVWRVQGRGPVFLKLGSRVLYERVALEAFAAASRRTSTSDTSLRTGREEDLAAFIAAAPRGGRRREADSGEKSGTE